MLRFILKVVGMRYMIDNVNSFLMIWYDDWIVIQYIYINRDYLNYRIKADKSATSSLSSSTAISRAQGSHFSNYLSRSITSIESIYFLSTTTSIYLPRNCCPFPYDAKPHAINLTFILSGFLSCLIV